MLYTQFAAKVVETINSWLVQYYFEYYNFSEQFELTVIYKKEKVIEVF